MKPNVFIRVSLSFQHEEMKEKYPQCSFLSF